MRKKGQETIAGEAGMWTRRLLIVVLMLSGAAANAQEWQPSRPIHIVVGFSPGATLDLMARALAVPLAEQLGQPVIVDNRSGGSGRLALELNAKAAPDGYTIGFTGTGPLSIDPTLQHFQLPPMQAISQVAAGPMGIVVGDAMPAKTLADLVALAKAKPGSLNFGSAGIGSTPHLAGELFAAKAGIKLVHVPYRGNMDALNDLLAGRVQILFTGLPPVLPLAEAGKVRILAVQASARSPSLPDVPTVAEAGVPGAEAGSIYGMIGPPHLDPAALRRLNLEIGKAVNLPAIQKTFVALGSNAISSSPEAYAKTIADDTAKWAAVIKDAGIEIK
jgi:tripartite-type tricarboxylate transporter receptor subunit TctC